MKPPPATTLASRAQARSQPALARGAAAAVTDGSAWLRRAKRGIRSDGAVYLQHTLGHCERSEAIQPLGQELGRLVRIASRVGPCFRDSEPADQRDEIGDAS